MADKTDKMAYKYRFFLLAHLSLLFRRHPKRIEKDSLLRL